MRLKNGPTRSSIGILHAITGLDVGGAEMMLLRLLGSTDRARFEPTVLSLLTPGAIGPRVEAQSVPVATLGMVRSVPGPAHFARLSRVSMEVAPDLIHGWMYHGSLAGTFVWRRRQRHPGLVWAIHHSLNALSQEPPLTQFIIRLLSRLSRHPQAIVYCSRTSQQQHEALGFHASRSVLIPNGFDLEVFKPDPGARARLLSLTGLQQSESLVGVVGRVHPMKDHANILRAAALLRQQGLNIHLVFIGRGAERENASLVSLIQETGLGRSVSLLGVRDDVPQIVPGLDVLASPSAWGEAFPLNVGEAMAASVPCVVTDVGDARWLVGDTGIVVPPRDSSAFAAGLRELIELPSDDRRQLGERARQRIRQEFTLETAVGRYEALYSDLCVR